MLPQAGDFRVVCTPDGQLPYMLVGPAGTPVEPVRDYLLELFASDCSPLTIKVADKVCAILEVHQRERQPAVQSTRYRDLADLAIFAHTIGMERMLCGVPSLLKRTAAGYNCPTECRLRRDLDGERVTCASCAMFHSWWSVCT